MVNNKETLNRAMSRIIEDRILLECSLPDLSPDEIELYGRQLYESRKQDLEWLKEEIELLTILRKSLDDK